MKKTALITGITGQDGSYLAELLLEKNYRVVGLNRSTLIPQSSSFHSQNKIEYVLGDLRDSGSLYNAIQTYQPDEIYNLASQSYPANSWKVAVETADINGLGAHRLFDIVKQIKPNTKVYQASSSEIFGNVSEVPQTEQTPFNPINPYAAAKLYAQNIAGIYRRSHNLFISCGILFNHESPRRGLHFITQKITYAAACIKRGIKNSTLLNEQGEPIVKDGKFSIGNLEAQRDWGFAGDYVEAMWLILQQEKPDDFVIGTGKIRTIRELCTVAFSYLDLNWENYVVVDPRFSRPAETGPTVADASKAKNILGWQPKTSFEQLIHDMVDTHLEKLGVEIVEPV